MDEDTLKSIIQGEISDSSGYISGTLTDERAKAMDYYLAEPFGNEVDGHSKIISSDVADTIEWIKPALLKTFAASNEAVRFDPEGPEDEAAAEQETDYVNHVFYKENEGFLILYTWFADALLQKNGVVKIFWDESERVTREAYEGLSEPEFLLLMQDPDLEAIEHTEEETPDGIVHDVVFHRVLKEGKATVLPVPPEEFLTTRDMNTVSLHEASFVAHRVERTVSELIEMGYDKKVVDRLPNDSSANQAYTQEQIARDYLKEDQSPTNRTDKAMRKVLVYECYIRVDYNGDGVAELRKVTMAGNEILDNEEVDRIPFAAITPIILPHKFYGLSVADIVMDLQLIKSTLLRQVLDNLYLTNNPMREVVQGQVNLDDLMTSQPGGVVRSKQPGMINNLEVPFVAGASFPMMEYIDKIREQRTGISENTMGQNQSLLNDTAHGVERLMTAGEARIELIARIFAETGVKDLFLQLHELLQKHQDKKKVIKLRDKWVEVDPREWRTRTAMTVKVGLGTGDRMKLSQSMSSILQAQQQLMTGGGLGVLISPKNIYNALSDFAKYNGIHDPEQYFTDPDSPEAQQAQAQAQQQQQPHPLAEAEQVKGQFQLQVEQLKQHFKAQSDQIKNQMEYQQKVQDMQHRAEIDALKLQMSNNEKAADRASREAIATATLEIQAMLKGHNIDLGKPGIGEGLQDG